MKRLSDSFERKASLGDDEETKKKISMRKSTDGENRRKSSARRHSVGRRDANEIAIGNKIRKSIVPSSRKATKFVREGGLWEIEHLNDVFLFS